MTSSKIIVLVLSIVMPQEVPDINHIERMKSFDDCWKAAREFTERDLSEDMRAKGAMGYRAACGYFDRPSERD